MYEKKKEGLKQTGRFRIGGGNSRFAHKITAYVLILCMMFTTVPMNVFAVEGGHTGICEHHTSHADECGYIEAVEGQPCGHQHTAGCYTDELSCGLVDDEDSVASDSNGAHTHTQECYALDCPHDGGEHDEACGYVEAVRGKACGYVCKICSKGQEKCSCSVLCTADAVDTGCSVCGKEIADLAACRGEKKAPDPAPGKETYTVTGFDELDTAVQSQTVPIGTAEDDLNLPDTLEATGYIAVEDTQPAPDTLVIKQVCWASNPIYDGEAAGTCFFTAVLPDGYTVEDGVRLPVITVTVEAEQTALEKVIAMIDALPTVDEIYANAVGDSEDGYDEWLAGMQETVKAINGAKAAYDALSNEEQGAVGEERNGKLAELVSLASRLPQAQTLDIATVDELNLAITGSTGTAENPTEIIVAMSGISVNKAITIDNKHVKLTGGTLTRDVSYKGDIITVKNGGSLTLENITLDGNGDNVTATGSLVYVLGTLGNASLVSALSMGTGANLINNSTTGKGGAVRLLDNGGTVKFTMTDGTISGNTASSGGAINDSGSGTTTIRITGGTISDNTANGTNTDETYGGAIYSNGALIIEGGEITGNFTPYGRGGGIFKTGSNTNAFTVTGGTISGNTARQNDDIGHNVYVNQCAFTLGGEANIPDGLYLKLGGKYSTFAISSALQNPVEIEAINNNNKEPKIGDLVASGASSYEITADDLAKFSYAENAFGFILEENQIKLADPKPAAIQPEADHADKIIYANGMALLLDAGSQTATNTVVYIDNDKSGTVTSGDTIFDPDSGSTAMNGTVEGNDLSGYIIYGGKKDAALTGDTSITMIGGKIRRIYGGGFIGSSMTGDTYITVSGGTVAYDIYGGGDSDNVTGNTHITVSGGTVGHEIYGGGGNNSPVTNSTVTIGGGAMVGGSGISGPLYGVVINSSTGDAVKNGVANFIIASDLTGSVNVKLPKGFDATTNPIIATAAVNGDADKIALAGDGAEGNEIYFDDNTNTIKVRKASAPIYWSDEGARATKFAGGNGSEQDAYQISTAAELGYMAYLINNESSTYKAKHYKLMANINLNGHQWMPMGSGNGAFMGTFDGGEYTITNMNIAVNGETSKDRFAGLFGTISGGTVKNVTIGEGSEVTANYTGGTGPIGYGGLVGEVSGTSTIENCHSSASVLATNESIYAYVGGVIGYLKKGTVKNCSNSGTVGGTSVVAGGVAGGCGNTSAGTIQNCWNTGDISVDGTGSYAGGIVGDNYHSNSKVENCYNTGNIEGQKGRSYYGGVAGSNGGTVKNCYSSGILTLPVTSEIYAGGLIGDNYYGSAINSYWRKDTDVNAALSSVGDMGTETNVLSFDNTGTFTESSSVTIGNQPYFSLLPALNAWVTAQSGSYWFWTGDAAAPTLTKDAPPATYAVTVNVNKDNVNWPDHGKVFKLVSGGTTVTNLSSVESGTYDVYEGDTDTGVDVTVSNAAESVTVDYYTVTFYDGSTAYTSSTPQAPQIVLKNGKATGPADPTKANFIFNKWVTQDGGNTEFDFTNATITAAASVYASWTSDPSTAVTVTLSTDKNAPYYNGSSLTLTANVTMQSNAAAVTTGTVQFYRGDEKLGNKVSYTNEGDASGFCLTVVCGTSDNFPFLEVGDNEVKAVYTSASNAATESAATTINVLEKQDGNSYVGALMTETIYNGSEDGNCPVQFTITNSGEGKGITTEQLLITGNKDQEEFTDFTAIHNEAKTAVSIYVKKPGTYTFTAVLENDSYAAEESATGKVSPASLTITPADVTIPIGGTPEFSYTADGLKGDDEITNMTYITTAGDNYDAVGEYTISIGDITMVNEDCYTIEKKKAKLIVAAYTITATPANIDFETVTVGYTAPEAQTITVTNTGTAPVTLTQPESKDYTISSLSAMTLDKDAQVTFTVTPKVGLAVGSYNETITVSTDKGTSAAVTVQFAVENAPIAQIGDQNYASLQDAFNAVTEGQTIKLLDSVTENVTTQNNSYSYSLDLNGQTLTYDGYDAAITHEGSGTFTITDSAEGGTVSATGINAKTIFNSTGGTITVSGNARISSTAGTAIYNNTGTVNVEDGTVSAATGAAIENISGAVTVSGGTVSVTTGSAITNTAGKVTVSGDATVTSANVDADRGTIYISAVPSTPDIVLTISGGTVSNTANPEGWSVYFASATGVTPENVSNYYKYIDGRLGKVYPIPSAPVIAYTITASAGAGGTISPSGIVSVSSGESQSFTISANSGYRIASVMVDGADKGAVGTYTFSNVTADHTISASFSKNSSGGGGGGGSSSGSSSSSSSSPATTTTSTTTTEDGGQVTTSVTTDPTTGQTVTTEVKKDAAGNITGAQASVGTSGTSTSVTNGQAQISTAVDGNLVNQAVNAAGSPIPVGISVGLPNQELAEQFNNPEVQNVTVNLTIPDTVTDNGKMTVNNITIDKATIEAAKAAGKDLTVTVKDEKSNINYVWTINGQELKASTAPVTDINLALIITPVKKLSGEKESIKAVVAGMDAELKGLNLHFSHTGTLPSVIRVRIPSGNEAGISPGDVVYLYYYNPVSKSLEALSGNQYTVEADGFITISLTHCSDYVLLPKKVEVPQVKQEGNQVHTIKKGDTLNTISQQYGCTVADIMALNPGLDIYDLRVGSGLIIPGKQ